MLKVRHRCRFSGSACTERYVPVESSGDARSELATRDRLQPSLASKHSLASLCRQLETTLSNTLGSKSQKVDQATMTINLTPGSLSTVFSDIEPTLQEEASPVASIAYTADFVTAFDYLRTCLRTDERSDRTLSLTTLCLRLNPANYTVWHYRRRILATLQRKSDDSDGESGVDSTAGEEKLPALDADVLKSELSLASNLGGANPKNYQVWYHRRALLEPILTIDSTDANNESVVSIAKDELQYISTVLSNDGKNYHAWSFRQYIHAPCPILNCGSPTWLTWIHSSPKMYGTTRHGITDGSSAIVVHGCPARQMLPHRSATTPFPKPIWTRTTRVLGFTSWGM